MKRAASAVLVLLLLSATRQANAAMPVALGDINPGSADANPTALFDLDGKQVLFVAKHGPQADFSVWRSDGTAAGTIKLSDGVSYGFAKLGGAGYFGQQKAGLTCFELKKTDGTPAGTTVLMPSCPGASHRWDEGLTVLGKMFFRVTSTGTGSELYSSDGTAANTKIIKDAVPGFNSFTPARPSMALLGADKIVYVGSDDQPWVTDGTPDGTIALGGALPPGIIYGMTGAGPNVFFYKSTPSDGIVLYRTNGTPDGTIAVGYFGGGRLVPGAHGNTLYFSGRAKDTAANSELWKSDGTVAGTVLVKDIDPGPASSAPRHFSVIGNTVYFTASTTTHGAELWKTDGTEAGTVMVKDIAPNAATSNIDELVSINGMLYFIADDTVHGFEVWQSDGTEAGTVMVADTVPGPGSFVDPRTVKTTFVGSGSHIFFAANDGKSGAELWALDAPPPNNNNNNNGSPDGGASSPNGSDGGASSPNAPNGPDAIGADNGGGCGCRAAITSRSTKTGGAMGLALALLIAMRRRMRPTE